MIVRRVRFTKTARGQLRQAKKWWRENRSHQDVLAEDVEEALFVIARLPVSPASARSTCTPPYLEREESTFVGWIRISTTPSPTVKS